MLQPVTATGIWAQLKTQRFGRSLIVEPELASTNTTAKKLAATGAPEGAVVVADRQSAGRGRQGRSFFSPQGGVYLSIVLRPGATADPGLITSCAAVACARAVRRLTGLTVGIKWVNDLLINGRKVCGILAEGGLNPTGGLDYVVLGVGVNVAANPLPPELQGVATSLEDEGCPVDRCALIAAILEEWERAYTTLHTGEFLQESRRLSVVLGKEIQVVRGAERFPAVAEAIDDHGHLVVRTDEGTITLRSGEVSIRL